MNTEIPERECTPESVLSRIVREGIAPRPRWHFLLREGCVWTVGALSVAVGSLAVAGIWFELNHAWWDFYEATHDTFLTFALDALPFVWVVGSGLFALLAYASIRYTKRGYRYPLQTLLIGSLALSGVGGTLLYAVGMGEFVDEEVGAFVPMHRSLLERERTLWMHPEEGRIAGIVKEIPSAEGRMWLQGVDDVGYRIDLTDFAPLERERLRIGDHVRVIGIPTTTIGMLHGCVLLMRGDDILRRAHRPVGMPPVPLPVPRNTERNVFFARSTECKGVAPYVRLAPLQH